MSILELDSCIVICVFGEEIIIIINIILQGNYSCGVCVGVLLGVDGSRVGHMGQTYATIDRCVLRWRLYVMLQQQYIVLHVRCCLRVFGTSCNCRWESLKFPGPDLLHLKTGLNNLGFPR